MRPMIPLLLLGSLSGCQQKEATAPNPAQEIFSEAGKRSIAQVRPLFESQAFVVRYKAGIEQPTREISVPAKAKPELRKILLAALESGECTAQVCDKPMYLCVTIGPQCYDGSDLSISSSKTAGSPVLLNTSISLKWQVIEAIEGSL